MARVSEEGYVRRVDVILRGLYPYLTTRIFELQPECYVIQFAEDQQNADAIRHEFEHNIRYATLDVTVANEVPTAYLREIATIRDRDVARDLAGIPFSKFDLVNLLNSRFPQITLVDLRSKATRTFEIVISGTPVDSDLRELKDYLDRLCLPAEWTISVAKAPVTSAISPPKDRSYIPATRTRQNCSYAVTDERRFFETFDEATSGDLRRADIIGEDGPTSRALIDCTSGRQVKRIAVVGDIR